jgi:hypothetical protein
MHQQIRFSPTLSPADLEPALKVIADGRFNIVAVGGSDHELGGKFAFAVVHGQEIAARDALIDAGYKDAEIVDVYTEELDDHPGALLAAVKRAKAQNHGKSVKDIAIGVKLPNGKVPIQIYLE